VDFKLVLLLIGIALFLWSFKKPKRSTEKDDIWAGVPPKATLGKIPELFQRLAGKGEHSHYVAFIVPDKNGEATEPVSFQLSNERGVLGFDWLLNSEGSRKDRERYLTLARGLGHAPREMKENGVEYLRTEDKDLVALCVLVLRDLYGINEDDEIELALG
jgi:hypothetical protein